MTHFGDELDRLEKADARGALDSFDEASIEARWKATASMAVDEVVSEFLIEARRRGLTISSERRERREIRSGFRNRKSEFVDEMVAYDRGWQVLNHSSDDDYSRPWRWFRLYIMSPGSWRVEQDGELSYCGLDKRCSLFSTTEVLDAVLLAVECYLAEITRDRAPAYMQWGDEYNSALFGPFEAEIPGTFEVRPPRSLDLASLESWWPKVEPGFRLILVRVLAPHLLGRMQVLRCSYVRR